MSNYDNSIVGNMSEEYFDFLEKGPIGIFRTTFDDKIEYINSSMAEMMGAENIGQVLENYKQLSKDFYVDSQKRQEFLESLKKNNEIKNFEFQAYKINGEKFWVSMNAKVVSSGNNKNKIEGFVVDITKRKEQEVKLRNQKEELAASNEQLSAFNEEILAMNEELERAFAEINLFNQRFVKMIELVSNLEDKALYSEKEFLTNLLENAVEIIPEADYGSVYIYKEGKVNFINTIGYELSSLKDINIPEEAFFNKNDNIEITDFSKVKRRNRKFMDQKNYNKLKKLSYKIKEIMCMDLEILGQKKAGLSLDISKHSSKNFTSNSLSVFKAFHNIASSFYTIKEYNNLQNSFTKELITSIIKILEMYDIYTKGHSENVAEIASAIAREMKLSNKTIRNTYWAGLVHDIGKLLVPLDIINKKGRLTDQEFELVKKHPVWGSEAFSNSKFLGSISEFILYHHERWDGRGYPKGLKENEIPLVSQIIGVADAWDAMLSKRAYRNPLSVEAALSELQKNKSSQFSPRVVEVFIKIIKNNKVDILRKEVLKNEINSDEYENYLMRKKEYFEDLFKQSDEGIIILDDDFNIIKVNDYFLKMFKYSREDIVGENIKKIIPETKKFEIEEYISTVSKGVNISSKTIGKRNDDKKIEVSFQAFSVSLTGKNAGYSVICRDITELENTKRKYENIKDRYKVLFENENTAMLIIDPDNGKIVDANPAAVNFYGWSKEKLTSMKISDINVLNKEEVKKEMGEAKRKNKNYFNFKHRIISGEVKDVEVYSQPIPFEEKEYLYSIIHEKR